MTLNEREYFRRHMRSMSGMGLLISTHDAALPEWARMMCMEEYRARKAARDAAVHVIALRGVFYLDQAERGVAAGRLVNNTSQGVTIACDDEELAKIENDARHYAGFGAQSGLRASVRATVRAIEAYRAGKGSPRQRE